MPPQAYPVQILTFNNTGNGELVFNDEKVNKLFVNTELSDRKVAVFSIVGAFRKGKSFLLNYVLRYMYANVSTIMKLIL